MKALTVALYGSVSLGLASLAAAQSQSGQPAEFVQVITFTVRPSAVSEYEAYIKRIVAGANKTSAAPHWLAYQVGAGGPGFTYTVALSFSKWAEVDEWSSVAQILSKAYGEAEGAKVLQSGRNAIERSETAVYRLLPDLSTRPQVSDAPAAHLQLFVTDVEPAMVPTWEGYLARLKAAQEKTPQAPTSIRRVVAVGASNRYVTAVPFNKYAERDGWPSALDVLREAYGEAEARALNETRLRCTWEARIVVLAYRPDLSRPASGAMPASRLSDMALVSRLHQALAGRYTIERELGRGGMATVYLARDLKHDRPVALKVLRPELAASLGPDRFLREIQVTAHLTHPNILPLLDSGRADELLYYVTPYVEGESLRSRLERERQLPVDEAVRLAAAVAGALDYAHRHQIIHRDIKPENILLEDGQAVVADFGIARALHAAESGKLTETGVTVGTVAYMSPEQATGEEFDGRSDIYSLGCVLYEMLAGEPPFTGPTAQVVTARRLAGSVPSLHAVRDSVPRQIEQAIGKALAKLPADRFATAAEFADALTPGGPAPRPTAFRLSWRRAGGVAAAFLAIFGAVLVSRSKTHGAREPASNGVAVLYFDNL